MIFLNLFCQWIETCIGKVNELMSLMSNEFNEHKGLVGYEMGNGRCSTNVFI